MNFKISISGNLNEIFESLTRQYSGHQKILFPWPDGIHETVWARQVGDELWQLDNDTTDPRYQVGRVVRCPYLNLQGFPVVELPPSRRLKGRL